MRRVSYNSRLAQEAPQSDEIEVVLVIIEHPDIEGGVIRLSSDPGTRVSVEPLLYGTLSTWRTETGEPLLTADDEPLLTDDDEQIYIDEGEDIVVDGEPFLFTMMDAIVPDEKDDAPSQASLVLEILDSAVGEILTSTTVQAICHMAVVMASSPKTVEGEWSDLKMTSADVDAGQAVLRFSTESLYDEPWPADRMTKERFPGLHR